MASKRPTIVSTSIAEEELSSSKRPLLNASKQDNSDDSERIKMENAAVLFKDDWRGYEPYDDEMTNEKKNNYKYFWLATIVLAFIAFCNLLLNITILIVLRVTRGMESLEVIPEQDLVKFYGNTDLDRVCLQRGVCEGFGDEPIELIGDAGGVLIQVANDQPQDKWPNLQITEDGISLRNVKSFEVTDPQTGETIFSTEYPEFSLPQGGHKLESPSVQTHRIVAPKGENLHITSDGSIFMEGAEGVTFDAKDIDWEAEEIFLESLEGNIIIDGKEGIYFPNIPVATRPSETDEVQDQFKVCICMPQGKLFSVPARYKNVPTQCENFRRIMDPDPCAT